jgi:hypothetical protein
MYSLPKRCCFSQLHGDTTQKTVVFTSTDAIIDPNVEVGAFLGSVSTSGDLIRHRNKYEKNSTDLRVQSYLRQQIIPETSATMCQYIRRHRLEDGNVQKPIACMSVLLPMGLV